MTVITEKQIQFSREKKMTKNKYVVKGEIRRFKSSESNVDDFIFSNEEIQVSSMMKC